MSPNYVANYRGCTCGSESYGWKVRYWDLKLNKMVIGINCGGCGKTLPID